MSPALGECVGVVCCVVGCLDQLWVVVLYIKRGESLFR